MSDNSKGKVLFLREEYADGEGTFKYSTGANMRDIGKMVKKMDLEYIRCVMGVYMSVSIRMD